MKNNIVFEITKEDEGGYSAAATGKNFLIATQGDTFDELVKNIHEATELYCDVDQEDEKPMFIPQPKISLKLPKELYA